MPDRDPTQSLFSSGGFLKKVKKPGSRNTSGWGKTYNRCDNGESLPKRRSGKKTIVDSGHFAASIDCWNAVAWNRNDREESFYLEDDSERLVISSDDAYRPPVTQLSPKCNNYKAPRHGLKPFFSNAKMREPISVGDLLSVDSDYNIFPPNKLPPTYITRVEAVNAIPNMQIPHRPPPASRRLSSLAIPALDSCKRRVDGERNFEPSREYFRSAARVQQTIYPRRW